MARFVSYPKIHLLTNPSKKNKILDRPLHIGKIESEKVTRLANNRIGAISH